MWRSPSVGAVAWAAQVHVGASVHARNHHVVVEENIRAVPAPLHRILVFVWWALAVDAFPCLHELVLTHAQDTMLREPRLLAQDGLHPLDCVWGAVLHPEGYLIDRNYHEDRGSLALSLNPPDLPYLGALSLDP